MQTTKATMLGGLPAQAPAAWNKVDLLPPPGTVVCHIVVRKSRSSTVLLLLLERQVLPRNFSASNLPVLVPSASA